MNPKYRYKERVKVTGGFYAGLEGTVMVVQKPRLLGWLRSWTYGVGLEDTDEYGEQLMILAEVAEKDLDHAKEEAEVKRLEPVR